MFEISWALRRTTERAAQWREAREISFRHAAVETSDADTLLIGVALSDGTTARSNDQYDWRNPGNGPRLVDAGSSGGSGDTERIHGTTGRWLYPLPPAPTMELVCAWPRFGLDESRRTIDTSAVLEAAASAHCIWPEDADLPLAQD